MASTNDQNFDSTKHYEKKYIRDKKIYFPNLDGLRFLAFFSVFLFHSGYTEHKYILANPIYTFFKGQVFSFGYLGVNFFFVLSGFLITYLLAHEYEIHNKINIKAFYLRRTLRIWPLYFACLIFGFFIFPLLKSSLGQSPHETANLWLFALFLGNFNTISFGLPDASILGVLWSVGIEEQFYLLWPILFIIFTPKRKLWMFLIIVVSSILFRYINYQNGNVIYFHTLSVVSDMAIGGLLGWLCFTNHKFIQFVKNIPLVYIILVYILGLGLIIFTSELTSQFWITIQRLVLSLIFSFVILEQNYAHNSFYKIGKNKFLTYWGKYTYGLYCLHFIGILITTNLFKLLKLNNSIFFVLVIETVVSLLLSMLLSWISFNYFEKYFLKLKNKFSY